MSEIKYGNFKNGCINCKRTSKRPEEILKMIFVYILLCNRTRKNDSVNGMSEKVASKGIFTKMAALVFHRILSNIKDFSNYKSPIYGYLPQEEVD